MTCLLNDLIFCIKMAPYQEEVDVFTVPHSRMKLLVEGYCNKLSKTDFSNYEATEALLRSLYTTFREFKSHETIENVLIMRKLKSRLAKMSYNETSESVTVCNCHSDNRLTEMLQLVLDGYALSTSKASSVDRIKYGRRLEDALKEFTSNFLPHMEEEEEIFQPMLIKYFEYEELKNLKQKVIEQHERLVKELQANDRLEKFRLDEDERDEIEGIKEDFCSFNVLPNEMIHKIFTYLHSPDLGRCAKVCSKWRAVAKKPSLWRKIFPSHWARGEWKSVDGEYYPKEDSNYWMRKAMGCGANCNGCRVRDIEADIDESDDVEDRGNCENGSCSKELALYDREKNIIENISEYMLPSVGFGVSHLSFAGCQLLEEKWLAPFLLACPNITHLNLSFTFLYDETIEILKMDVLEKRLESALSCLCPKLAHLNLTGCKSTSDRGLADLFKCLFYDSKQNRVLGDSLKTLNLCGCARLSDDSLTYMMSETAVVKSLRELDLSGCWSLSGEMLCRFTESCPSLDPQKFSYCDLIVDGPYQTIANGCQNLESECLFCCCSSY